MYKEYKVDEYDAEITGTEEQMLDGAIVEDFLQMNQ